MKYYASFETSVQNLLLNRAINYGDGVFETLLLSRGRILLAQLHWSRLNASLQQLGMQAIDPTVLEQKALSMLDDEQDYVLKLVVFRDDNQRGYASQSTQSHFFMTLHPFIAQPSCHTLTKSSVVLGRQSLLAGIKHLNRLEQVLAASELKKTAFSDAIMCDAADCVIETTNKNILLFKQDKIYSPALNQAGVYGVALRWLQTQGYEIICKKIEFSTLSQYHGMMVCNSIQGFSVIEHIDNSLYFKQKFNIAKQIKSQWDTLRDNRC